jgi:Zn-dependent protease
MESPFALQPDQPVKIVGHAFGTPLVVQGLSWLPANQAALWALFTRQSWKRRPGWAAWRHLGLGGLKMVLLLRSEWCHNLAHAAAARAVGQPVDAIRIVVGMPLLLYNQPEHPAITPRQHVVRSLAGPLFNLLLLALSLLARRAARRGSPAGEVAGVAVGMNTFVGFAALAPVPVFDGGPVLKWSMIAGGASQQQAEQAARRANRLLAPALLGSAGAVAAGRRWLPAALLALVGAITYFYGFGNSPGKPIRAKP